MSPENKTKLNRIIQEWPRGTVCTAAYLATRGIGYDLIYKYKKSHWIQQIGRGAYALYGDKVSWTGVLYALQKQLDLTVHPGGKTALEMKGFSHFLSESTKKVFLFGLRGEKLPDWFKQNTWRVEIIYKPTNLFSADCSEGFSEYREKEFSLRISSPERAAMEMMYHIPNEVSFEEASLIAENLISLRPVVVQALLECCNSVKVKRLFMYMADKHKHPWVQKLVLSKIDFGTGKRMIAKDGVLDGKYHITVPKTII